MILFYKTFYYFKTLLIFMKLCLLYLHGHSIFIVSRYRYSCYINKDSYSESRRKSRDTLILIRFRDSVHISSYEAPSDMHSQLSNIHFVLLYPYFQCLLYFSFVFTSLTLYFMTSLFFSIFGNISLEVENLLYIPQIQMI